MTKRYELPDGRHYDVDDKNCIWRQRVSEGGAGATWDVCAVPGDPEYAMRLTDILIRGKVVETWE